MTKEQLLQKWQNGTISEAELRKQLPEEEVEVFKAILAEVDQWEPAIPEDDYLKWTDVQEAAKEQHRTIVFYRSPTFWSLAASFILVGSLLFYFFSSNTVKYDALSENKQITLPDNSTFITIAPQSTLSYTSFDLEDRVVTLAGRAFIDVRQKGNFKVIFEGGEVSVLGTQFEIVQFDDYLEVTCFEGVVEIVSNGNTARIEANQKVKLQSTGFQKSSITANKPLWISGVGERFENDGLSKVIKVLEQRFQVKVNTKQIDLNRQFTGSFTFQDLETACKTVFIPLGISFEIEEAQVLLSE